MCSATLSPSTRVCNTSFRSSHRTLRVNKCCMGKSLYLFLEFFETHGLWQNTQFINLLRSTFQIVCTPLCLSTKSVDTSTLFRKRSRCLATCHYIRPALKRRKCTKNDTRVFSLPLLKHTLYVQIHFFIAVNQSEPKHFFNSVGLPERIWE